VNVSIFRFLGATPTLRGRADLLRGGTMPFEIPRRKSIVHYDGELDARSLTFSCFQRVPFLNRDRTRDWMIKAILLAREKHPIHIWAYVVMPEHVHLLIWPNDREFKMENLLSTIKQSVSKRALNWLRSNDPEYLSRLDRSFTFGRSGRAMIATCTRHGPFGTALTTFMRIPFGEGSLFEQRTGSGRVPGPMPAGRTY
jgi:hypothetical protein